MGLAVLRSLELIVAILGILKSGAAYLPLDPEHPVERLRFTLKDAQPKAVLTTRAVADKLPETAKLLVLDQPEMVSALAATPSGVERKNKPRRWTPKFCLCHLYVRINRQAQRRGGYTCRGSFTGWGTC